MSWDPARNLYEFSPSWLYNQVNSGVDSGASIATTMELVVARGADTAAYFPYDSADWVKQPDGASFSRAARFRAQSWSTIAVSEQNLKQVLASGNLVVAGVQVFPDFDELSVANPVYDSSAGTSRGGQAIVLFGYNDEKKAFRFRNQWGESWGDHGDGWLAYTFASEPALGMVAYVMTDSSNSPPRARDNLYLINQGSLYLVDKYFGDSRLALNSGLSGATSMTALNGGLYIVEQNRLNKAIPDTSVYRTLGSGDWSGLTQMAVVGTTLYAIHDADLLAVDSSDGTRAIAAPGDWNGTASIAGLNGALYLLQTGALHKVDPLQGSSVELGSTSWSGPAQLTSHAGRLFGVKHNALLEIDPNDGSSRLVSSGWNAPAAMTSLGTHLYLIDSGNLYQVDPGAGTSRLLGAPGAWSGPTQLTALSTFATAPALTGVLTFIAAAPLF